VSQANNASSGAIKQQHLLSCANATQANACSPGSLGIPPHLIVAAPVAIDNVASASTIVQTHLVRAASGVEVNTVSSVLVAQQGNVVLNNYLSLARARQRR